MRRYYILHTPKEPPTHDSLTKWHFNRSAFWLCPNNFSSLWESRCEKKNNQLIFWIHRRCNSSTKHITFWGLAAVAWSFAKDTQWKAWSSRSPSLVHLPHVSQSIWVWIDILHYGSFAHFHLHCIQRFSNLTAIACFSNFRLCLDVMPAAHYFPC